MTRRGSIPVHRLAASAFAPLSVVLLLLAGRPTHAQLISPGKLSAAHSQLEGLSNCTKCHELGKPGTSDARCLSCHEALRTRIDKKTGLHATNMSKTCASCHKEHFGSGFALVRFDTAGFDHTKVGFELKLGHRKPGCRECHTGTLVSDPLVRAYASQHKTLERTYLGLATGCLDCHRKDNVHAGQFASRGCSDCHTEESWEKAPLFNHDLARYVLTGKHRSLACEKCHKPMSVPGVAKPVTRYAGVTASSCTSCHTDPHEGRMRETCERCHSTDSWARLRDRNKFEASFDHSGTSFLLKGAHAKLQCAGCHDPGARPSAMVRLAFLPGQLQSPYPAPRATECRSCHIDVHDSTFARTPNGPACQNCHSETSWLPASYDLSRHNRETYVLTGAHVAVPCSACHPPNGAAGTPRFKLESRECVACHRERDPHAGQFAERACSECHVTDSFRTATFDHSRTGYALTGAHIAVTCSACHPPAQPAGPLRFKLESRECLACHRARDPHAGQFPGRPCSECHVTDSFRIDAFDHSRTRYPLDGAHKDVACAECHTKTAPPDVFTRYRPIEMTCRSCHGAQIPRPS